MLAVGAAGSRRITSSLAHVLSRVERPLLHRLGSLPDDVRARRRHDYVMGSVHAVARRADGTVDAAADPRREGTATTLAPEPRPTGGTP